MPHRLRRGERDVPVAADVLVLHHDRARHLVAGDVVEAVVGPARAGVGADERGLRGRQIGVDVVDAVDVAVVDELRGAGDAAGQAAVNGEVAAPHLREAELVVGDVQLVAGGGLTRRRRLVAVEIRREREPAGDLVRRGVGGEAALQHAGVAKLIGDPHVERLAGEDARAAAQLGFLIAGDVVVEAEAGRPQDVGAGHLAAVVLHRLAGFITERQRVRVGVEIRRVLEHRHVEAQTGRDAQVALRTPHVLRVGAAVERGQRLLRLVETGQVHVAVLVLANVDRRRRPVGIGQRGEGVGIEVVEAVVDPRALLAAVEEHVVRVIALEAAAKGELVLGAELREVVLHFERLVAQLVVRRERLAAERQVGRAALQDVDEREQREILRATLVARRVGHAQAVGHRAAEHRVPLASRGLAILQNLIVRALVVDGVGGDTAPANAGRARARQLVVRARVQLHVVEEDLVARIEVEVGAEDAALLRRVVGGRIERPGVVVEIVLEERAELLRVRREHTRHVAADRLGTAVGASGIERARVLLVLEVAEREKAVLDDRGASPHAGLLGVERARVEGVAARLRADEAVVAEAVVGGGAQRVGAAAGDGVDAGADEVALAHVVGRDADLHLLDRFERDRRDAGAFTRLAAEAERVVERGAVDGHVVHAAVAAGERVGARGLRGQAREVADPALHRR